MDSSKKTNWPVILIIVIIAAVVVFVALKGSEKETDKAGNAFLGKKVDYQITGIEPGAGIMINTEEAMKKYGLKEAGWELKDSSSAAMLAKVREAVNNKKPVVATVWEPHAVFAVTNLRKLEDSKNVYNSPSTTKAFLEENAPEMSDAEVQSDILASIVYKGFSGDAPAAYAFLENFNISADAQSKWILKYSVKDQEPLQVAKDYLSNNPEKVKSWKPENKELGKSKLTIGIPPWPGATVKSRVAAEVLRDMGYGVEIKEMDVGVVYTGLAQKQIDINVAGWLPTTHGDYWNKHKDSLEIAGINVTKTWLGLGVPEYTDESIQSVSDLVK